MILIPRFTGTIAPLFLLCDQVKAICLSRLTRDFHTRFRHEYVMLLLWLAKDDHHLAFLGLLGLPVFERHCADFALYCQDLHSANSAVARLKLMVSHRLFMSGESKNSDFLRGVIQEEHMDRNSRLARMIQRFVSMSDQLLAKDC